MIFVRILTKTLDLNYKENNYENNTIQVTIADLTKNYKDDEEGGVFGYDDRQIDSNLQMHCKKCNSEL